MGKMQKTGTMRLVVLLVALLILARAIQVTAAEEEENPMDDMTTGDTPTKDGGVIYTSTTPIEMAWADGVGISVNDEGRTTTNYLYRNGNFYDCGDDSSCSDVLDYDEDGRATLRDDAEDHMTTLEENDALSGAWNDDLEGQVNQNIGFLGRFTRPVEMPFWDAVEIAGGFVQLGIENDWWSDDSLMGDFLGVSDFIETEFGQIMYGNWEQSICRYTTDYNDMAADDGALVPMGQTSASAWITGEVQRITHPSEDNPSRMVEGYWHRIELSVSPGGLTEHAGESDCNDHVKFYIKGKGPSGTKRVDVDMDGSADLIDLACEGSTYSLTGASALVIPLNIPLDEVCLEFHETDFNARVEQVLNGNTICNDVKVSGAPPDMGSCSYCPGSGGGVDLGFDLDLDLGLGGGDDDDDDGPEPENRPQPPAGDEMPEGGNVGMV